MPTVAITTEVLLEKPGRHRDLLREAGFDVRFPPRVPASEDDSVAAVRDCVAVIAGSEPYTDAVLARVPQLRVISRNGVGYDRVEVPAATRRGIAVTITPEGNHQAVAEHTLALLLAVARSVVQSAVDTRQGRWSRRGVHIPLRGKTLGIVGLGRIGRSVAVRARGFGMRVVACEKAPDLDFLRKHEIELVELDALLAASDFVTLHAPMTPETRQLIHRDTLARMKRGSLLVNTSRGGLVNEEDLLEALRSEHLAGAGLDVLATEPPPPDHPLLAMDNVVVTPHVAALDSQAVDDMALAAAKNVVELLSGGWPAASLVNPEVKAKWSAT